MIARFTRIPVLILALWLTAGAADAQQPREMTAAKRADIGKLMALFEDNRDLNRVGERLRAGLSRELKKKYRRMPKAATKIYLDEAETLFRAETPKIIDRVALLYHETFSHAEVKTLFKFFTSDIGRKMTRGQKRIKSKARTMGSSWVRSFSQRVRRHGMKKVREAGYDPNTFR